MDLASPSRLAHEENENLGAIDELTALIGRYERVLASTAFDSRWDVACMTM